VGERDLTRTGRDPAAEEAGLADGVVRRTERPSHRQLPVGYATDRAGDPGNLKRLGLAHRRQDRRDAGGRERHPGTARPGHQEPVAAGGGHLERASKLD
jgi:hypothetical protein